MIIRDLACIEDTVRDVRGPTWRSRRIILAGDKAGYSLHDTVLYAGTETRMWYANHVEAVYITEGEGEIVDHDNGFTHALRPGVLYLLDQHEHHTLRVGPHADLRCVCVFNPPCTGLETHDEEGAFPLLVLEEG